MNSLGYDCGTPDGAVGENTRNAIRSFRVNNGMGESDTIDKELMWKLVEVSEKTP